MQNYESEIVYIYLNNFSTIIFLYYHPSTDYVIYVYV